MPCAVSTCVIYFLFFSGFRGAFLETWQRLFQKMSLLASDDSTRILLGRSLLAVVWPSGLDFVQWPQAFDRTGRIVNITVAPQNKTDPPRLLNYLTAPHVLVWSAAVCSSSVPGVFEPSVLLVKDADGR